MNNSVPAQPATVLYPPTVLGPDVPLPLWRFLPVFVDLQGVPEQSFFHAIMAETVDALDLSPSTRQALRFRPQAEGYDARNFSHYLQQVIAELRTRTDRKVKLALLIDEVDSTCVVPPGCAARLDSYGNIEVEIDD